MARGWGVDGITNKEAARSGERGAWGAWGVATGKRCGNPCSAQV